MAVLTKAEIAALSIEERLALIDDIWDSFEAPLVEASVEVAHRRVMEERLANYDPSSDELLTLDEVHDRLRAR